MLQQLNVLANKLVLLGSKIYNTLIQNWLYLVLAFIAPLLILYVSQGQEIILSLFHPSQYINLFFILISFILIFFFIWVIPSYGIELALFIQSVFSKKNPGPSLTKEDIFKRLAFLYNSNLSKKPVFPIRKFGGIPLLVFLFSLGLVYWEPMKSFFLFFIFLLISLTVIEMCRKTFVRFSTKSLRDKPFLGYFGHLILILGATLCWRLDSGPSVLPMGYTLAMICIWMLFIYNDLFQYLIENLSSTQGTENLNDTNQMNTAVKIQNFYSKSKNVYTVAILVLVGFIICFACLQYFMRLHFVSAILILNICFTLYIALIDLFLKTPKDVFLLLAEEQFDADKMRNLTKAAHLPELRMNHTNKLYLFFNFLNIVIIFISINTIFINSINDHKLYKLKTDKDSSRQFNRTDSLLSYFTKWLEYKSFPDTVHLVIASGGGSRAGYWTGITLDSMARKDTNFRKNLFAISTISGSSSGANMVLNKWFLEANNSTKPDSPLIQTYWKNLYSYNYLSSSVWGLLFSDGIRGWMSGDDDYDKDRNYYHELDEVNAFKVNYPKEYHSIIDANMHGDYMLKWKDQTKRFDLPIHMVNSATTQAGKRAIVVPYTFSDSIHTTAIDLYGAFQRNTGTTCTPYQLPMIACVKISESFPIISAYSYLNGVGNLIDGGLYENTGSNTMYELYAYLKEKFPKQIFKVYFVLNSDVNNCNTRPLNSVLINTFNSISSTPFSGHSYYWVNRFKTSLSRNGDAFDAIEIRDRFGMWKEFPLGIQLSNQTIDSIFSCIKF